MKFLLPFLVALTATTALIRPQEMARRQAVVGYSNSILHENPAYPDQAAQSSVSMHFNPNNQLDYYNPQPQFQQYQPAQTQAFNVGYSVSFAHGQQAKPAPKYQRTLGDGDIITGTRKRNEQVQVPNINMSPEDFVSSALIDSSKHKKPPAAYQALLNLSPTTQKYLKSLEQARPAQAASAADLQQRYSWRSLSPSVEIIRSTEIPGGSHKYGAMGRSQQEYEYANTVDGGAGQQKSLPPITRALPMAVKALPVDTSLLRAPVDTRLLDEALRVGYKPSQQYAQASNDDFRYRQEPVQFQEYQTDAGRYQVRMYGKPHPLPLAGELIRQPRYLVTNLRPPPYANANYQRRNYLIGY